LGGWYISRTPSLVKKQILILLWYYLYDDLISLRLPIRIYRFIHKGRNEKWLLWWENLLMLGVVLPLILLNQLKKTGCLWIIGSWFWCNRSYQDLINKIDYFKNLKIKLNWCQ
jgi:hypothetical protein